MGRKKKPVREMTSEQLAKRLFPAKVVSEAKKVAHEKDDDGNGKTAKKTRKKK